MTSAVNPASTSGDEREHVHGASSNGTVAGDGSLNGRGPVAVAELVAPRLEGVPPSAPAAPIPATPA